MKEERLESLRKKIFEYASEYYDEKFSNKFEPEKTFIPATGKLLGKEELVNLLDASLDMWFTSGRYADEFEKDFSEFLGVKHCALVNSGSSANLLAISALTSYKLGEKRLKPGDEVITVAAGFPTTITPIIQNNLVPVFVDIEIGTYNIDVANLEQAITDKTKAIFLAHTLGNPFNLNKIMQLADKYNLWIIEDNCDALGSKYNGKYTGTFGHISTFSFYPAHHITMGEGGAVLTNDNELYRIILSIRDWGRDCWCKPGQDNSCNHRFTQKHGDLPIGYDHKYVYSHLGYNLKLTDMQAAIGLAQLKKLPQFISTRKKNAEFLYEGLKKYDKFFVLPKWDSNSEPNWFSFPLTIKENAPFTRNELTQYLEDRQVGTRLLFAGNIIKQPVFVNNDIKYKVFDKLKNTDINMERTFSIGCFAGIGVEEISYILKYFDEFISNIG